MDGPGELANIGQWVRDVVADEPRAADELRQARAGFLQEVDLRRATGHWPTTSARRRLLWWPMLLGAAAAAAVTMLWLRGRPIEFRVGASRAGSLDVAIEPAPGGTIPVTFSEGSTLNIHDGGRIRVLSLEREGARVLVENGVVDASITPRRSVKTRWNFDVGPYRVTVNGTRFSLAFVARNQSLRVVTQEGRVTVSGGCLRAPRAVSAGESLDASCTPLDGPPAPSGRSTTTPPPAAQPRTAALSPDQMAATRGRDSRPSEQWRDLLAAGQLEGGLRAAERRSLPKVCNMATTHELLALADAARFFGPSRHAVTALTALRRRFPGSMEAATAAFMLGRVLQDKDRAYVEAATWFETYLREQPSGPLMGDAFGRLMETRRRAGDQPGARTSAEQYLRRFPKGPYASEARGILSQ